MNKKGFISFILVTVLLWSVGVQPVLAQISDVPRDHWAYHAVVTLVNKGYLAVYEDGTFQGSRPVDRYTLAVTVARILDDIEAGRVQGTVDDLALIEELTTELRTELVAWYAERAALEDKLASAEQLLVVTDDRLNRVVASHTELQAEVAAIKAEILEQLRQ
ncbi:MAG: S-layer homology domain-containing protein, partial [Firmicutes bacterium]|nr:S-layer homology domain-containing protein [Bacillota bacterium]